MQNNITISSIVIKRYKDGIALVSFGEDYYDAEIAYTDEHLIANRLNNPVFKNYALGFAIPKANPKLRGTIVVYGDASKLEDHYNVVVTDDIYETDIIISNDKRTFKEFNDISKEYYANEICLNNIKHHASYINPFLILRFAKLVIESRGMDLKIIESVQFIDNTEFDTFLQHSSGLYKLYNNDHLIDTDSPKNLLKKYSSEFHSEVIPNVVFSKNFYYLVKDVPKADTIVGSVIFKNDNISVCFNKFVKNSDIEILLKTIFCAGILESAWHQYAFTIVLSEDHTTVYEICIGLNSRSIENGILDMPETEDILMGLCKT